MILTVLKKLKKFSDGGILSVRLLEKFEKVSLRLWRYACLVKLRNFLIFWYNINVSGKPTERVSDNVGFARLMLNSEAVSLNGKDLTYDTVCC